VGNFDAFWKMYVPVYLRNDKGFSAKYALRIFIKKKSGLINGGIISLGWQP
jgi:hypothetical protein